MKYKIQENIRPSKCTSIPIAVSAYVQQVGLACIFVPKAEDRLSISGAAGFFSTTLDLVLSKCESPPVLIAFLGRKLPGLNDNMTRVSLRRIYLGAKRGS